MNPVVRQILDNIGRFGRELENCEPNPPHPNGGTMSNERTVSVEGEVSRIFRRSAAQPSGSIYTSNATFTSTVNNVITTSTSTSTQQGPSNSTNSTLSPRFRLSYNLPVKRIYLLYLQTVLIIAGPGVTIYSASKQHVHGKRHILSLKSKFLET